MRSIVHGDAQRHHDPAGSWGCLQIAYADQVVRGDREREHPLDPLLTAMPQLAESAHRLQPSEDLFNALALPLTDGVARMPRRAAVDRTPAVRVVLRDMRGDLPVAQLGHKVLRIVVLV